MPHVASHGSPAGYRGTTARLSRVAISLALVTLSLVWVVFDAPTGRAQQSLGRVASAGSGLQVHVSEPSPEQELLRGVHGHATVYTVEVDNGASTAADDLVVTGYLEAGLEFLQCGDSDNGRTREYVRAASLKSTNAAVGDCLTPDEVATVVDPIGYPPGTYTRVGWTVGGLAPGQVFTFEYAAGIPLRANTAHFAGHTPSPESLGQAANLDNNHGASTVESDVEQVLSTYVHVGGQALAQQISGGGASKVSADASYEVTAEDVAMQVHASPLTIAPDRVATYTLTVETSEYADASDVVITDYLPNGMCPLDDLANYAIDDPAECAPSDRYAPTGGAFEKVVENPDGTFDVTFTPLDVKHDRTVQISFMARMRATSTGGEESGDPTRHRFSNNADLTARTTTATRSGRLVKVGGRTVVGDSSSVSIVRNAAAIAPPKLTSRTGTGLIDTGNGAQEAVVGERVRHVVSLRVSPGGTLFNGVLTNTVPAGLTFRSVGAAFSGVNDAPAEDPLPPGILFDTETGSLSFGTTYVNTTNNVQLFQVIARTTVTNVESNKHGVVLQSTAAFNSTSTATGGTQLPSMGADSTVTVIEPDPSVTKEADAVDPVVAGQEITYTLTAANRPGRPILHDSWAIDCLPDGLVFGSFAPGSTGDPATSDGTGLNGCGVGQTRIAWHVGDLTTGQELSYTATVSPSAAEGTSYTNTATLTGSTIDNDKADPQDADILRERTYSTDASRTITVEGHPGTVNVSKAAEPASRTIGQSGDWTVTATLPAHVNFFDSAIIDQVPEGIDTASVVTSSVTCAYPDSAVCAISGGGDDLTPAAGPDTGTRIGWLLGDMGSDSQERTVTVTYNAVVEDLVSVARGDALTNQAHLSWDSANGADPTSADALFDETSSNASADVSVIEPVLSIDKDVSDMTPAPGDDFTYTVDVSGLAGPNTSAAYRVEVVDTIPVGVVVGLGTISNGGELTGAGVDGGGTITWVLPGPIAAGDGRSLTYDAVLADSSAIDDSTLTNTADITSYFSLATGGRQYDGPQATAAVTPVFPHVSIAKSVNDPLAYIGESTSWTITVTSDGDVDAQDVDVIDTLPTNWSYDDGSAVVVVAGGPAIATDPSTGTADGRQTLTWTDIGDLPVGQTIVITYASTPQLDVVDDPGVGSGVPHTNDAAVTGSDATGGEGNADEAYNGPSATASAAIDSADVSATTSHTGVPVAGTPFSWTVLVSNNGADVARGPFVVVDDLPQGIGSATATGDGWGCSAATGFVTCARIDPDEPLASGGSFPEITLTADVPSNTPAGTDLVDTARVSAHTYDPDTSNNESADIATAARSADLAIDKALVDGVVAGSPATYTLTIQDNGPSDSDGPIVVIDTLPEGTDFVSAGGDDWSCDAVDGDVTCTRDSGLLSGQVAPSITVVIDVPADRETVVTNTAAVDGPEPDPEPDNDTDGVTTTPTQSADLGIEKQSVGTFVAGEHATYRLTVHNFGPSSANSAVRITDTLPDELGFEGSISVDGGWTCWAVGQDVTCELSGPLTDGDDAIVDVFVEIDPDHTGNIHNAASVTSTGTSDPNAANDSDDDDSDSTVESDLVIDKSHVDDVAAGSNATYTLAMGNQGPSSSAGPIVVSDVLPAGMSYVSATGTGWNCDVSGQTITCTRAAGLGAGIAAPDITVVAGVPADAGPSTLDNVASVSGPESDPVAGNNTDHDPTTIVDESNISLTKSVVGDNPVVAGLTTSFEIAVHNDGPSDADAISVVDSLPSGMSMISATGTGWDCSVAAPVACTRDTIAAGNDAPVITVVVRVGAGVTDGAALTNSASASTATSGDNPADNSDTATVDVVTSADLAVVKSYEGGPAAAGTQVTFGMAVGNQGPSDAGASITVTDTLPVGMTFVVSGGSWSCAADAADAAGQVVTCELASGLLVGAVAPPLSITVQIASSADVGTLTNTAEVSSGGADPDPTDNTDTADVSVTNVADVSIVLSHADQARVGDTLDLTLLVANTGPSDARGVEVSDVLPTGLEFVSATGDNWTCGVTDSEVTCAHDGRLVASAPADEITITVRVLPTAYPGVVDTAVVSSTTPDPADSNNTSTDTIDVPPLVDISIVKSHPQALRVGRNTGYRLTITNAGPTLDPGPITVTDVLPTGLTFVAADSLGWSCGHVGQTVTCVDADGMLVGDRSVIVLIVTVGALTQVTNTATVESAAEDLDPSNNTSSDSAPVLP